MKEEKHIPFRGQQYPVKSTTMSAGLSLYDHKHDKEISGNEGWKVMRGIVQNKIVMPQKKVKRMKTAPKMQSKKSIDLLDKGFCPFSA